MKKDMKIKVYKGNIVAVRQALEKLGYDLPDVSHTAKYYYTYAGDNDVYYGCMEKTFEDKTNEEYFLVNGVFTPKSYWTQPYTGVSFTIYGPESEQFKKAQKEVSDRQTSYTETTYEPLPFHLKPRSEFLHERNVDIINVMLEYVTEGKRIPDDMISELTKNNEEIYGSDF